MPPVARPQPVDHCFPCICAFRREVSRDDDNAIKRFMRDVCHYLTDHLIVHTWGIEFDTPARHATVIAPCDHAISGTRSACGGTQHNVGEQSAPMRLGREASLFVTYKASKLPPRFFRQPQAVRRVGFTFAGPDTEHYSRMLFHSRPHLSHRRFLW